MISSNMKSNNGLKRSPFWFSQLLPVLKVNDLSVTSPKSEKITASHKIL